MTEPTWDELAQELVDMRTQKGFNPVTRDNFATKLACIFAELNEVKHALHGNGDPAEEVADVAMYALAAIWDLREGKLVLRNPGRGTNPYQGPEQFIEPTYEQATKAFECWRRSNFKDAAIAMELVFLQARRMAVGLNVNLKEQIQRKIAKNLQRDYRHGGKHPDT